MTSLPPAPDRPSLLSILALAACGAGLAAMGAVMVQVGGHVAEQQSTRFAGVHILSFKDEVSQPGMAARGRMVFAEQNCAQCHGHRLEGIVGPCLTDPVWIHGGSPDEIRKTLEAGVPAKGMPSFAALPENDKAALVAFIYSRKVTPILLPLAKGQDSMKRDMIPDAAVPKTRLLTPAQALADFRVPADCVVDCLASEPMVVMPVAAAFDARGRLWVVEIRSFMRNVDGTGEHDKNGCLAVLEDTDGDGVFDKRTDLFTNLVSPRAVLPYNDGILFADDTRLLWAPVGADLKPGKIEVVDENYARGGSVEHKPNGLLPHLDGWIYNAKSGTRYRRIPGTAKWRKSGTSFRGQWGISSDDFGRLASNTNSNLGFVDVFLPNTLTGNARVRQSNPTRDVAGTAVAPRRVTPGINRAYLPKQLDIAGKLVNCTSACAPWFARGAALGQWQGLFVCEPTSYLLKYIRMEEDDKGQPKGTQPITETEFLTATDELFRPVFLADSPDGSLLVVDMHVGIVQHSKFVSGYLRRYILKFGLDKFTGFGRLYRIRSVREPLESRRPALDSADAATLVKCLSHPSGWWRDMARRQLVERGMKEAAPALRELLKTADRDEVKVQALWALANLGELQAADLPPLMAGDSGTGLRLNVCQAALGLPASDAPALSGMLRTFTPANPVEAAGAVRLAATLVDSDRRALDWLLKNWAGKPHVNDAAFVGLGNGLAAYAKRPKTPPAFAVLAGNTHAAAALAKPVFTAAEKAGFNAGKIQFDLCAGCHGQDGGGLDNQGPPLDGSQWVTGDKGRLLTLLLCGLNGPVTVAGEKIEVPMEMPGLGQNKDFSDKAIADVATYIRNAWNNRGSAVTPAEVANMREQLKDRMSTPMTEPELLKRYGDK